MKLIYIIGILSLLILSSSCSSSKHLAQEAMQREQLSKKLGFKLNKKDNLRLYTAASHWLGVPYRSRGMTLKGTDCSGLVGNLYQEVYHKKLSRSAEDIAKNDCHHIGKSNLKAGDLVFFNTLNKKRKKISHVGLFLKNGYFIHASTSKGVIISNLDEDYYRKTWKYGGKVTK